MSFWSFKWLASIFKPVTTLILPLVHGFLNVLKEVVQSPIAADVAAYIPNNIGTDALNWLKAKLPIVLAEYDIVIDFTNATTVDEINAELHKAFSGATFWKDETTKEKFLSSLGARLFAELHSLADGTHFTFGQAVTLLDGFYKGYIDAEGNPIEQP